MEFLKRRWIILLVVIAGISGAAFWFTKSNFNQPQVVQLDLSAYEFNSSSSSVPVNKDNLLVFAIRINDISLSLNKAIRQGNLNIPPVKFFDINKSCGELKSWFYSDEDLTIIFLCRGLSNTLTKDEVIAYSVHEICHISLGHAETTLLKVGVNQRDINKEKEADRCAVSSRVDPTILMSAINKLSPDNNEKLERIADLVVLTIG